MGVYKIHPMPADQVIYASYVLDNELVLGIFNVGLKCGEIDISVDNPVFEMINHIPDGDYVNLVNDKPVELKNRRMMLGQEPVILSINF